MSPSAASAELSDAALVVAVGRYRQDALAELYRRHGGAVHGLALRVLGERALAEEVTQEVFLRLWNQPERFDPTRGSLRSLLLAQAHGRAVDTVRSEGARRRRETRDATTSPGAAYDLETEVAELLSAERVRAALDALSAEERTAIELAYFGGRTYRQVAAELGVAEGTVKSRIRVGLRRLRDVLLDERHPATAAR